MAALFTTTGGHIVEYLGMRPYTKPDGTVVESPWFKSHCIDCGAPFEQFCTPNSFPSVRRCEAHRGGKKRDPKRYPPPVRELLRGLKEAP